MLYYSFSLAPPDYPTKGNTTVPISHKRKLRLREVKLLPGVSGRP